MSKRNPHPITRQELIAKVADSTIFVDATDRRTHFERHLQDTVDDLERLLSTPALSDASHFEFDPDELPNSDKKTNLIFLMTDSLSYDLNNNTHNDFFSEFCKAPDGGAFFVQIQCNSKKLGYDTIGRGLNINKNTKTFQEYEAHSIRIVAIKDLSTDYGFVFLTAYPCLYDQYTVPVYHDLSNALHQTKTYQNSNQITKMYNDCFLSDATYKPFLIGHKLKLYIPESAIHRDSYNRDSQPYIIATTSSLMFYLDDKANTNVDLCGDLTFEFFCRQYPNFAKKSCINQLRDNVLTQSKQIQTQTKRNAKANTKRKLHY